MEPAWPATWPVGLPARDAEASARHLADVLGVEDPVPDGPDNDMFNVALGGCSVRFVQAQATPGHHLAFRVAEPEFRAVVERLVASGVDFGNDPEESNNGQSGDPLGGRDRVYFVSPDGHLFEVTIDASSSFRMVSSRVAPYCRPSRTTRERGTRPLSV
jgi:catechol 2,3-dioxygenase-like lactoylglutathione lyase family enzyme